MTEVRLKAKEEKMIITVSSFYSRSVFCYFAIGLVSLISLFSTNSAFAENKIAIIDLRKAVISTEDGLRVDATLRKLNDAKKAELTSRTKDLEATETSIKKLSQDGKTTQDVLAKKYQEYEKKRADFENLYMLSQQEIQENEVKLYDPIKQKMLAIVKRIASLDGFDVIVDKSAVPFFRSDLEVTDKAIQMYNTPDAATKTPATQPPATPSPKPSGK